MLLAEGHGWCGGALRWPAQGDATGCAGSGKGIQHAQGGFTDRACSARYEDTYQKMEDRVTPAPRTLENLFDQIEQGEWRFMHPHRVRQQGGRGCGTGRGGH